MSEPFADAAYYAQRTGQPLSDDELTQIDILLAEASGKIRSRAPGIDDRIGLPTEQGGVDEVTVKGIACDVVLRYLANPSRASQQGDGPFTSAWSAANARGLSLTDDEVAELNPPFTDGTPPVGVGTFRLSMPVTPRRCW